MLEMYTYTAKELRDNLVTYQVGQLVLCMEVIPNRALVV